ncbi:hypothetical protein SAR11G3_00980 [Candidatus Pelagibacter sp. IMCC9063]|uniref:hypothetical protein n=1 Tax=Pelagibacter sp. (strain IMCC9063) TaxID=1002672 RepID=UPI0002046723|nr:hypothetical protein [Candidatus Pelagibacter sp. IMCC9063]AEA81455.1 hypothetical protein SAR11G3_00980 [Candidatus Pelagibacter sp. IMCC9063]
MKKLFSLIVVLGLLLGGNAYSQSMIALKKYIQENDNYASDPITFTYVLKRCSAAYIYATSITKDSSNPENLLKAFRITFNFAAKILMKKMNWTEEVTAKSLKTDIDNMMKYLEKDGNESFAKTGIYMMNNYIGGDLKICNGIVRAINK